MSTPRVTTIAALLAGLALSVLPAAAQEARQEQGGSRNPRAERGRPRESGNGGQANRQRAEPRESQRAEPSQAQRNDNNNQNQDQNRRQAVPRGDNRGRTDVWRDNNNDSRRANRNNGPRTNRNDWNRNNSNRNDRNRNNWNNGNRGRDRGRPYVGRPIGPSYRYYSAPRRTYVVPYGYRPYGRRPGWSTNLYFGSPFAYRSGGFYNRGYTRNYGYYAIPQGFAYGSLRIVDAPRDAQVFVDGYYAGVVDDYDGVFQRLNLEPGEHQLEVEPYPGAPPLSYDVYVEPGRTVTVHVQP